MMRKSFKNNDHTSSPDRVVKYVEAASYKAVRLPYKGCSISAIAVLPTEQAVQKHGLAGAIAELDVHELLDASKYRKVSRLPAGKLKLEMPRFKVKTECMSVRSVRSITTLETFACLLLGCQGLSNAYQARLPQCA